MSLGSTPSTTHLVAPTESGPGEYRFCASLVLCGYMSNDSLHGVFVLFRVIWCVMIMHTNIQVHLEFEEPGDTVTLPEIDDTLPTRLAGIPYGSPNNLD